MPTRIAGLGFHRRTACAVVLGVVIGIRERGMRMLMRCRTVAVFRMIVPDVLVNVAR